MEEDELNDARHVMLHDLQLRGSTVAVIGASLDRSAWRVSSISYVWLIHEDASATCPFVTLTLSSGSGRSPAVSLEFIWP